MSRGVGPPEPPRSEASGFAGGEAGTRRGRALRARLRGEPPGIYERIGPTFAAAVAQKAPDESRPSLERYRRHDEIELLPPV